MDIHNENTKEGSAEGRAYARGRALEKLPIPACVVDSEGKITYANELMEEVFAYKGIVGQNFFALTGVKREDFFDADSDEIKISRNDNYFVLETNTDATEDDDINVYFINVTQRETYQINYHDEQPCYIYISIDNYDELIQRGSGESGLSLAAEIDRCIMRWAEQYDAAIERTDEDAYTMTVYKRDADRIIESKFQILDEVRNIETDEDLPVSLSIGMGMGVETLKETTELAEAALEMALGRGGDQAVVKDGDRTNYYGGTLMSYEKNNKGKSRIIAHAMKRLIQESSKVFIMGHANPDMDSFGAALGAYTLCNYYECDAYIVIEEYNEALSLIYKQAKDTEDYDIIGREKALSLCDENSLVIVVDTNKKTIVECPELTERASRIVVIDHHRVSEDSFENPTLSYVESYASSASELMVEVLQYSAAKRIANKFEAEAMLAGIVVDTNSFSIKTGVRTFEAAAWLRRAGADTTEVKRFFQTDRDTFRLKAEAVAKAEFTDEGIAFATTDGESQNAQIINAQVADQLLEIKGIKGVFVVGKDAGGTTVISARSLGDMNVQVIMEKFGGGGHLNSAGAQIDMSPEEFLAALKVTLDEMRDKEEATEA